MKNPWLMGGALCVLLLAFGLSGPAAAQATGRLNDTGQSTCVDLITGDVIACGSSGQDAESGRDVTSPKSKDGRLGFHFTKIAADGSDLPSSATEWSCVRDETTGLMWEVKTNDGGLHDKDYTYTNHGDGRANDSSSFVAAVNAAGWCGHQDWRLPERLELFGLVDRGSRKDAYIDNKWFPNTRYFTYLTGTAYADDDARAWCISGSGWSDTCTRIARYSARLVRPAS